jgi:alpha-D-ribose 1-methylphosphonate 5-triphosphate synthase subunit PhnG
MIEQPRESWTRALVAVPEARLAALVNDLASAWQIRPLTLPQAGLGMLKLRDSAFNDPFYLGEFPLACCAIRVTTESGATVEGAAQVMDDRLDRVEQLALCDAILAGRLPGWRQLYALLQEGERLLEQTRIERKAMLARTRVDFSLLDDVGG